MFRTIAVISLLALAACSNDRQLPTEAEIAFERMIAPHCGPVVVGQDRACIAFVVGTETGEVSLISAVTEEGRSVLVSFRGRAAVQSLWQYTTWLDDLESYRVVGPSDTDYDAVLAQWLGR